MGSGWAARSPCSARRRAPPSFEPLGGARRRAEHGERAAQPLRIRAREPRRHPLGGLLCRDRVLVRGDEPYEPDPRRSEEHTSELQSLAYLVCRLLLEKKK